MRIAQALIVAGAMILTGGGGYVVVLAHVARTNRDAGLVAVGVAVLGAAILAIGLLSLREQK